MPRYYAKKDKSIDIENIALISVGPLKLGTPAKKSNRGRKPMKSAVLTSPENVPDIRDKAEKKRKRLEKKGDAPQKKIPSPAETDDEEYIDFCIVCSKNMPKKENRQNTAYCISSDRGVHLKCAGANPNTFTCVHCDSD